MRKKLLLFSIVLMLLSYKVEKFILNHKITTTNILADETPTEGYEVISNRWTHLIINGGALQGIKVNRKVKGHKGFVGIVIEVYKNHSVVQTYWYSKWNLIVVNGNGKYGTLKSNGYFLILKTKDKFENEEEVAVSGCGAALGTIKKTTSIYKIIPHENLLHIKRVFVEE